MIFFFFFQGGEAICLHFTRQDVYIGTERKQQSGYTDEARGLLFSLLISLNLLIPILKAATLQRRLLLCVALKPDKSTLYSFQMERRSPELH